MQDQAQHIRQLMADWRRTTASTPYPAKIRQPATAFAIEARNAGMRWNGIQQALGIHETTLRNWKRRALLGPKDKPKAMVPVSVWTTNANPPQAGLVLVSPTGYRLEGLALTDAVQIMAALS